MKQAADWSTIQLGKPRHKAKAKAKAKAKRDRSGLMDKPKYTKLKTKPKSSQSTAVKLRIGDWWYHGLTGKGCGHAEMHALHIYIQEQGGVARAIKNFEKATVRTVECLAKPVCSRCSQVLKALEFTLHGTTQWSAKSMGSTQWGASMNVKAFLKAFELNVDAISTASTN
ncbi:MAG TPA: hypothetical protein VG649_10460 [Candidatus Angelobacter sp.]|jgi:hypothetical protein|nr:hypothetical protein [Candidatus Angelobacter sp.]